MYFLHFVLRISEISATFTQDNWPRFCRKPMGLKRDELRGVWPCIYMEGKTSTFWALERCRETTASELWQWNRAELQQAQWEQLRDTWLSQHRGRAQGQHQAQESTGDLRPSTRLRRQQGQRGGRNKGQLGRKWMFDPRGTLPPARHRAAVKPHVHKACTGGRACCCSRILVFWSLFRKAPLQAQSRGWRAHRAQAQG